MKQYVLEIYVASLLVLCCLPLSQSSSILVYLTPQAKSHHMNLRAIAEELAGRKGHNLLVISCNPLYAVPCRLRD